MLPSGIQKPRRFNHEIGEDARRPHALYLFLLLKDLRSAISEAASRA